MLVLLWDYTSCTRESGKKQWRQRSGKGRQQFPTAKVLKSQGKETLSNSLLRANLSMSCSVTLVSHAFPKLAIRDVFCYQEARILGAPHDAMSHVTKVFLCVILYPFIGWYSLFSKCIQGPPCLNFHDFDWTCNEWYVVNVVTSLVLICMTSQHLPSDHITLQLCKIYHSCNYFCLYLQLCNCACWHLKELVVV